MMGKLVSCVASVYPKGSGGDHPIFEAGSEFKFKLSPVSDPNSFLRNNP